MALQQYISASDIKGTVFQDFSLSGVVADTNDHLEALALSLDCYTEDIAFPVNPLVKEYLVNYASRQCALLKIGTNNVELTQDKYIVIHSVYNKEVERLRQYITYDVITDQVDEASETSRTSVLYRG
jgi:hypothetical protein